MSDKVLEVAFDDSVFVSEGAATDLIEIVVERAADFFQIADAYVLEIEASRGPQGLQGVNGGGGGGGSSTLAGLTDVTISSPAEGQVLVRAGSAFVNRLLQIADVTGLAASISDRATVSDVNTAVATAKARGNHTGTQAISTIDNLATTLVAKADLVGGVIPANQIPALALNATFTVASQAAMLALTAGQVQPGDIAVRTDGAGTFILTNSDPTQIGSWTRLNAPTDLVTSVAGKTGTVSVTQSDVGLGNVNNTADTAKPVSTAQQAALDLKATINSPTFTGTVSGITKAMVGLSLVDNTSDAAKPISTAQAIVNAAKADLVGGLIPTSQLPALALASTQVVASQAAMLALTASQVQPGDIAVRTDGTGTFILTSVDPSVLANWQRLNSPTDVVVSVNGQLGTVNLGKADVGLANVDNTTDLNKPVSTATAAALTAKADKAIGSTGLNVSQVMVLAAGAALPAGTPAGTIVIRPS